MRIIESKLLYQDVHAQLHNKPLEGGQLCRLKRYAALWDDKQVQREAKQESHQLIEHAHADRFKEFVTARLHVFLDLILHEESRLEDVQHHEEDRVQPEVDEKESVHAWKVKEQYIQIILLNLKCRGKVGALDRDMLEGSMSMQNSW